MAQIQTFDANTINPSQAFEVLPEGKYVVQIINSEMRDASANAKDPNGKYLWLEMEVLEGEYSGRKVYDRLNLINNNPQAVEIAQKTLSSICHAVGELVVNDSEQLHWKPMTATLRVRPPRGDYSASNEIRGYEPKSDNRAQAQASHASSSGQNNSGGSRPPWKQN